MFSIVSLRFWRGVGRKVSNTRELKDPYAKQEQNYFFLAASCFWNVLIVFWLLYLTTSRTLCQSTWSSPDTCMNSLHWFIVGAFNPPSIMFRKYEQTVSTSSSEKNLKNKLLFEMDLCTRIDRLERTALIVVVLWLSYIASVNRIRILHFALVNIDPYWQIRSRCRIKEI
jgi:hypothetical protein